MSSNHSYTYVIVGAGIAGCVLASSLSADPALSVLLVEAGAGASRESRVSQPCRWPELVGSEYDWAYRTTPQRQLNGRVVNWPRGRMLGGSSAMNAMVYVRGDPTDYDGWAHYGGPEWSWSRMAPWFEKVEGQTGEERSLSIVDQEKPHPLSEAFLAAGEELGFVRNEDFNCGGNRGVGLYRLMQRDGCRFEAYEGYLAPALSRPNLTVLPDARAVRVIVQGHRAVGVQVWHEGGLVDVMADQEVIISAGTVESPHLLLLSGIGPADHLREHDVDTLVDLPGVGRNLHDHVQAWVGFACRPGPSLDASSNIGEAGGFACVLDRGDVPDVQLSFVPLPDLKSSPDISCGCTIAAAVTRPASRGQIRLASADPRQPPLINPGYLVAQQDLDTLVAGVRLAVEFTKTRSLGQYRNPAVASAQPTDIAAYCRDHADTQFHPVGTCRLGNDRDSVVDSELRVFGIDRLRVVDASVIPVITTGNISAPVFAIAAKASALIIEGASQREH
jgi:choline dehydrogenase-like flavoprotein